MVKAGDPIAALNRQAFLMKKILVFLACCLPLCTMAQRFMEEGNMTLTDINGKPVFLKSEYHFDGSPFFKDEFCIARLKVINGKTYENLPVKLNLQDNRIIYRQPDGVEMEAVSRIEFLEFVGCANGEVPLFRSGYPPVDDQNAGTYYQVLESGPVQLLKLWRVSYIDQKPYGSASTVRKFERSPVYYAYTQAKGMIPLGKGNELALLLDQERVAKVNAYARQENLRLRKEEDLRKLIVFYNAQ